MKHFTFRLITVATCKHVLFYHLYPCYVHWHLLQCILFDLFVFL